MSNSFDNDRQHKKRPHGGDEHTDEGRKRQKKLNRSPLDIPSHILRLHDRSDFRHPLERDASWSDILNIRLSEVTIDSEVGNMLNSDHNQATTLLLIKCSMRSSESISSLVTYLKTSPSLQDLRLHRCKFHENQWKDILEAVRQNPHIQTISLDEYDGNLELLSDIKARKLELMYLPQNIPQQSWQSLVTNCESLVFDHGRLSAASLDALCASLQHPISICKNIGLLDKAELLEPHWAQIKKISLALLSKSLSDVMQRPLIVNHVHESLHSPIVSRYGLTVGQAQLPSLMHPQVVARIGDQLKTPALIIVLPVLTDASPKLMLDCMNKVIQSLDQVETNGLLLILANVFSNREAFYELDKRIAALFHVERVGLHCDSFLLSPEAQNLQEPVFWAWKKIGTSLNKEYARFLQSRELISQFGRYTDAGNDVRYKGKEKVVKALEQWFMLRANGDDADSYPVSELKKQNMGSERDIKDWVIKINEMERDLPHVTTRVEVAQMEDQVPSSSRQPLNVTVFSAAKFSETLQRERGIALIQAVKRIGAVDDAVALETLLTMLLRYAAVFGNFRQYCTSGKLFQEMVDKHHVNREGFSSPFNAQILLCKAPYEGWSPSFGSCYPDTDTPFGAVGSLFHQSFDGVSGLLHPPSVAEILTSTVHYMETQLAHCPCRFVLVLPAWDDLEAQTLVRRSKYLESIEKMDPRIYLSQNPYTGEYHSSSKYFDLIVLASSPLPTSKPKNQEAESSMQTE